MQCLDTRDSAVWRWVTTLASSLAAAGAGYLAFVSLVLGVPPAGCGAGSSCGEVLSSSWAKLFGVPVSLPALGLYLGVIFLAHAPPRPRILQLRMVAAGAIGASLAWFVFLQAFILQAFCPYCMVDHVLGFVVSALLIVSCRQKQSAHWALAGIGCACVLAVGQTLQPRPLARLAVSSAGDFDRTLPQGREVGIHDGQLRLRVSDEPRFGPMDAHTAVVLMFDYACPHCQHLHRYCRTLSERSGDLLVIALPTPLGAACNRFIPETGERFRESCELTRLSLAVFFAAPARWAEFDHWLFDAEQPRSARQAREQAIVILGTAPDAALKDERVGRMLERNVGAFGAIPAATPADRRLPVMWSPGRRPIVGPVESSGVFIEWLNRGAGYAHPGVESKSSNK
jgi:uncharacterized membrane protein